MLRAIVILAALHLVFTAMAIVIVDTICVQQLPRDPTGPYWELLNGLLIPILLFPPNQLWKILGWLRASMGDAILLSTLSWTIAIYLPCVAVWRIAFSSRTNCTE